MRTVGNRCCKDGEKEWDKEIHAGLTFSAK